MFVGDTNQPISRLTGCVVPAKCRRSTVIAALLCSRAFFSLFSAVGVQQASSSIDDDLFTTVARGVSPFTRDCNVSDSDVTRGGVLAHTPKQQHAADTRRPEPG